MLSIPPEMSHNLMSSEADAKREPSGENETALLG